MKAFRIALISTGIGALVIGLFYWSILIKLKVLF
jgi:hypothetical protein